MRNTYPSFPDAKWVRWLNIALLLAVVLSLKLPVVDTPFYWDEMGAYIEPSHWLAQGSLMRTLPGLHPDGMFFGHPPLLYTLVALAFKLFNGFLRPAHAIAVGFAFLGCYFTYRLGSLLYGWIVGMTAALILLFMPLYFAQAGMLLGDLPIAALGVMTVYFLITRRYGAYVFSGCCLVMVKETGIALIAAVAVYQSFLAQGRRQALLEMIRYTVPLVPILAFFVAQKATTGSFLPNPYFEQYAFAQFSPYSIVLKSGFILFWIFFAQGRFLLTGLICAAFVWRRALLVRKELLLFALIVIFFAAPFSFIYFVPRYSLPTLPFVAIAGAAALSALSRQVVMAGVAACIVVLISPVLPDRKPTFTNFETDLQYLDVVQLFKESGAYLAQYHMHSPVYAQWPLDVAFSKPYLSYVPLPLNVVGNPADAKIVVTTTLTTVTEQREFQNAILRYNFKPYKAFEKKGKAVTMYCRD